MDGIDRDHFLDFSTKSKNFNLPKHIQLLRCGALQESEPPDEPAEAVPSPSDPLVGGLPMKGRTRINGSKKRDMIPEDGRVVSGMGPELFDCVAAVTPAVVETRRLELLTLSLQRRCSTS